MEYEIIQNKIKDTSEFKKGKNILYKCTKCHKIIPSLPKDNLGCDCGNVFIDIDYGRLAVEDYSAMVVLKCLDK